MAAKGAESLAVSNKRNITLPGRVDTILKDLAQFISGDLAPKELASALLLLKDLEKVTKDLYSNVRRRTLDVLQKSGTKTTDKGTLAVDIDGWHLEARPQKTGLDATKVEGLLRAKGDDMVVRYMAQVVSYEIDEGLLGVAVSDGALTQDELETCRYEPSWAVQTPKRVASKKGQGEET